MMLALNASESTKDVGAVFHPAGTIRDLARIVQAFRPARHGGAEAPHYDWF